MTWEKALPAILSGILPGAGQIYNCKFLKGLDLFLLQGVLIFLLFFPIGEVSSVVVVLAIPLVWVYSVADAGGMFDVLRSRRGERNYYRMLGVIICVGVVVGAGLGSLVWELRPDRLQGDTSQSTVILNPRSTDTDPPVVTLDSATDVALSTDMELASAAKESLTRYTVGHASSLSTATELDISQSLHPKKETHQVSPPQQYVITVGTFHLGSNAEKLKTRLIDNGHNTQITPKGTKNQTFYIVSVMGGKTVEMAEVSRKRLATQFPDCYVAIINAPEIPILR